MTENDIVDYALSTPLPVGRLPSRMRWVRAAVRNLGGGLEGLSESAPNNASRHASLYLIETSVHHLVRMVGLTATRRIVARVEDGMLLRRRQGQALLKVPSDGKTALRHGRQPRQHP